MKKTLRFICLLLLLFLGYGSAFSQKLPFQGRLIQNGLPINDTVAIAFSLSDVNWSETHAQVAVKNGLYSVVLGSITPLPAQLFDGADERSLGISVNGTALSPVKLYPSLSKVNTRYAKALAAETASDTAFYTRVTGGASTGYNIAAYNEATTQAGNIAFYGKSVSQANSTPTQYGVVGEAVGEGTGLHLGVYGEAAGKGRINYGSYSIAYGPGDGSTGLENGSYNDGAVGVAQGNSWGNAGVFGRAHGTKGVDNLGVVGWSEVITGSDTTENKGVLGWAKGTGINKGIVGLASGGKENWAGWFDGNVHMQGKYLSARLDSISLNDVNGRQAIVMESMYKGLPTSFIGGLGTNGKYNYRLISNGPDRNYGNLDLLDANGRVKAWLSAYYNSTTNQAAGLLSLYSPGEVGWIGAGFKQWEPGTGINLPYISLEGNTLHGDRVWISVNQDENGLEHGMISLKSDDGKELVLTPYTQFGIPSRGPNTDNFLMTGKDWEGKGDYPLFELRGTINSAADGSGYTLPLVSLNTQDNGSSEWGSIAIEAGTIGSNTTNNLVRLDVADNANVLSGQIALRGPASDNVTIGGLGWEANGSDRGRIHVLGNSSRADGNGGSYNPVLLGLEVRNDGSGEYGKLFIQNETQETIWFNGFDGSASFAGTITSNGTTVTSDARYKESITTLENALANVSQLRGVSYTLKQHPELGTQIGVIAQEVEQVYPEFVHTNAEGYKSVNYAQMVAVLIEAVKELENKIELLEQDKQSLQSENVALKNELQTSMEAINQRMSQLEQLMQASAPASLTTAQAGK